MMNHITEIALATMGAFVLFWIALAAGWIEVAKIAIAGVLVFGLLVIILQVPILAAVGVMLLIFFLRLKYKNT